MLQTDEDGQIYMSMMQLRDQTDELQSEVEQREKTGDIRGAELCQQKLNKKQQELLEASRMRSVRFFCCLFLLFLFSHHTREVIVLVPSKQIISSPPENCTVVTHSFKLHNFDLLQAHSFIVECNFYSSCATFIFRQLETVAPAASLISMNKQSFVSYSVSLPPDPFCY